ncbi:MAG: hypothetical protein M0T80_03690 [Actinomycetota bacterium]|nr:hypothetical protein [Actinomycetota bacterium]
MRNIGARVPPEVFEASAIHQDPSLAARSAAAPPMRNRPLTASLIAQ